MAPAGERAGGTGLRPAVVPALAGRSLWLTAIWTGVGAAFVGAVVAIVGVAICWLPASGTAGNAESAIHAGLLTLLTGLHGGVTVDGTHATFVPLGLTIAIAALAWRAGAALADTADDLEECDAGRLLSAGACQLATFAVACGITSAFATLGTSSTSPAGTALAAAVLWLVTGSLSFVRSSPVRKHVETRRPGWAAPAVRLGAATLAVFLGAGALLTAGSLALHHSAVSTLSRQVGGGWSGVPVLLLGMLTTPNAAIAGAGYLAGPGFAVGGHTVVRLWSTAHGTVPAFPLLGGLPHHPAGGFVWFLAVATPLTAGCCAALLARRTRGIAAQWRDLGAGVAGTAVFAALAATLGGGGIGDGPLATIGVSPWQFALTTSAGSGAVGALALGATIGLAALRRRGDGAEDLSFRDTLSPLVRVRTTRHADGAEQEANADAITTPVPRVTTAEAPDPGELAG